MYEHWAIELCRSSWGLDVRLVSQGAERDVIYRVEASDGRNYLLRLTEPTQDELAIDFQNKALLHVAKRCPDLQIPVPICALDGRLAFRPDWDLKEIPIARLFSWCDGRLVVDSQNTRLQAHALGRSLAHLDLAFSDFDHPGAAHYSRWDLRRMLDSQHCLAAVCDDSRRRLGEAAFDRFRRVTADQLDSVRQQIIHGDLTPYNALVVEGDTDRVAGIIDFGDTVKTSLVADVAIAACYFIGKEREPLALAGALVSGFNSVFSLTNDEIRMIAPLMEARHALTVAITEHHAAERPENKRAIKKNTELAWRSLEILAQKPINTWSDQLFECCAARL